MALLTVTHAVDEWHTLRHELVKVLDTVNVEAAGFRHDALYLQVVSAGPDRHSDHLNAVNARL